MSESNKTPMADAKVDAEQAQAGTGTLQTGFTETGQQNMSDVNVQELQSTANALMTASMATLKASLDGVAALRAQNAAMVDNARAVNAALIDNMSQLNSVHLNNLVNSASHRHSEIAADRQWNINETDFYAFVAAAVAAAVAKNAEAA